MRSHNVFWELEHIETCAFPAELIKLLAELRHSSVCLYLYLLNLERTQRRNPVTAHTKDALSMTGLHRHTLQESRAELIKHRLIDGSETARNSGVWKYTLLNPQTGGSLPSRDNVDFRTLPDDVVTAFYQRMAPNMFGEFGAISCPFGVHTRQSFKVIYKRDDKKHGGWACSRCDAFGGMIEFVTRLRKVDRGTAHRMVRSLLHTLLQEADDRAAGRFVLADALKPKGTLADL